jgi:hypothetical protein
MERHLFAPVAMNGTNRVLLCVAAQWGRYPRKGDITSTCDRTDAFESLYGDPCRI